MVDQCNGSKDGQGSADHDREYAWGHPLACMDIWQKVHLVQMRADIRAYKAGQRGGAAEGDLARDPNE
jgi:hypothetical protein